MMLILQVMLCATVVSSSQQLEVLSFETSVILMQEIFTSSFLSVQVRLSQDSLPMASETISINLIDSQSSLSSTAAASYPKSCNTDASGICELRGISIKSAGKYYFTFQSSLTLIKSAEFSVKQGFASAEIQTTPNISAFGYFDIGVSFKSPEGGLWNESEVEYSIQGQNFFGKFDSIVGYTTSGSATISVFTSSPGTQSLQVLSGSVSSEPLELIVLKDILSFDSLSTSVRYRQTLYVGDELYVVVNVCDDRMEVLKEFVGSVKLCVLDVQSKSCGVEMVADAVDGKVAFTTKLMQAGKAKLVAYSEGLDSVEYGQELEIMKLTATEILVEGPEAAVSAHFSFKVTVKVLDERSDALAESVAVTLTANSLFVGDESIQTSDGVAVFTIYFTSSGSKQLTFSTASLNKTLDLTILSEKLLLTLLSTPSYTLDEFSLKVEVFDNSLTTIESNNGNYTVALSLLPDGAISGVSQVVSKNGVAVFNNLLIAETGTYTIKASCEGLDSSESASLLIQAPHLNSIEVQSSHTVTQFFSLSVKFTLKDQRNYLWNDTTAVSLTSTSELFGQTSGSAANGVITLSFFLKGTGDYTVKAHAGQDVAKSFSVSVLALSFKMDVVSNIKSDSNSFEISVEVMDHEGINLENKHGEYLMVLGLEPSGELYGETEAKDVKTGKHIFYGVSILGAGEYSFKTSIKEASSDLESVCAGAQTFEISEAQANVPLQDNKVMSMNVELSTVETTAYFRITAQVELLDANGDRWTQITKVYVSGTTQIFGMGYLTTRNGTGTFEIFFKDPGEHQIEFSIGVVSRNFNITVLPLAAVLTISPTINADSNSFDVLLEIFDNQKVNLLKNHEKFSLALALDQGNIIGNTSALIESASHMFTSIVIVSETSAHFVCSVSDDGTQVAHSTSSELLTISSEQAHVPSSLKHLTTLSIASTTSVITAFFDFSVTIGFQDQIGDAIADISCGVALSSNISLQGDLYKSSTGSSVVFSVFTSEVGAFTVFASGCGLISESIAVNSLELTSKMIVDSNIEADSNYFNVYVGVYNNGGTELAAKHGDFELSISLDGEGTLIGKTSAKAHEGYYNFTKVVCSTPGSFKFVHNVKELSLGTSIATTDESEGFVLTEAQAKIPDDLDVVASIEVVIETLNITSLFNFEIAVTLKDQIGELWEDECQLSLSSNTTLYGKTTVTAKDGAGRFSIYTARAGTLEILLSTCTELSKALTVTVLQPTTQVEFSQATTESSNSFNATVSIYDSLGITLLQNHGDFKAKLLIDADVRIIGEIYKDLINGVATFENLVVGSIGEFTLSAEVKDADLDVELTGSSAEVLVVNEGQNHMPLSLQELVALQVKSNNTSPSMYFIFEVNVLLLDQLGDKYIHNCDVGLISNTSVVGDTYALIKAGEHNFAVYSELAGALNLMVSSCADITESIEITVLPLSFQVVPEAHITSSSNYFNVYVAVLDSSNTFIEATNGAYSIQLTLSPEGSLSGLTSHSNVHGSHTFSSVSVLSSGTFQFRATIKDSNGFILTQTALSETQFVITENNKKVPGDLLQLSEIKITAPEAITVFEEFLFEVEIKDQENNYWTNECTVVINANSTVYGSTQMLSRNGSVTFSVYFKETGLVMLTVLTCESVTSTHFVELFPYRQELVVRPYIAETSNYFELEVGVFDYNGTALLSKYGEFDIAIGLIPEGASTDNVCGLAVAGKRVFTPVTILEPGSYQWVSNVTERSSGILPSNLQVISPVVYNITEENARIPESLLKLTYIAVATNVEIPTAFFTFEVTINLFDQINNTWMKDCEVSVSADNGVFGETSGKASNGVITLPVFMKKPGVVDLFIQTETGLQSQFELKVAREVLMMTTTFVAEEDSNYFDIAVGVYDRNGEVLEDANGEYTISLHLVPDGRLAGRVKKGTKGGIARFRGVSIMNEGSFQIVAECNENSVSYVSSKSALSENKYLIGAGQAHIPLSAMQVSAQKAKPTQYYNSWLEILLFDINGDLLNDTYTVNISSHNSYIGLNNYTSQDGNITFLYHFTEVGKFSIDVRSKHLVESVEVDVQSVTDYALLMLIVLFWMLIIFTIIFYIADRNVILDGEGPIGIYKYCPLITVFYTQHDNRRLVMSLRSTASAFIMFTLVGYFFNYGNQVTPDYANGIDGYSTDDCYIGFLALFFTQLYSFPISALHFYSYENKTLCKIIGWLSFIIILLSMSLSLWMMSVNPAKYNLFWCITYLIFASADYLILQTIYAFCFTYCCNVHKDKDRYTSPLYSASRVAARVPLSPRLSAKQISVMKEELKKRLAK